MTADYMDWNTSNDRALSIYNQTVPLGRKPGGIGNGSSAVAAGGTNTLVNAVTTGQPSFQMLIGLATAAGGVTVPFGRLGMQWIDTASGFASTPDFIFLPGGVATLNFAYIRGPVLGDQLTMTLKNLDPAQLLSYSFGISQISHVYEHLIIEEVDSQAVTGFTRPGTGNQMGNLGSVGANIPVSSQLDRLAQTWGGPAILSVDNLAGAVTVQVRLLDPGLIAGGTALYGIAGSDAIAAIQVAGGDAQTREVALPNGPVVIREINVSAANAVQPTTTLMRLPV